MLDRVVVEADDPERRVVLVHDLWPVRVAEQQPAPSALPVRRQRFHFLVQDDGTNTSSTPLCSPIQVITGARHCDSDGLSSCAEKRRSGTVVEKTPGRSRPTLEAVWKIEKDVTEYEDPAPRPTLWRCGRDCAHRRASADKSDHAKPCQGFQLDPPLFSQPLPVSWKSPCWDRYTRKNSRSSRNIVGDPFDLFEVTRCTWMEIGRCAFRASRCADTFTTSHILQVKVARVQPKAVPAPTGCTHPSGRG